MTDKLERPSDELLEMFKKSGSNNKSEAIEAQAYIAKAIETPLREGVLFGDVVSGIYQSMPLEPGSSQTFPTDLLAPGTELEHVAYTIPNHGRIPERSVESDEIRLNTYRIGSSVDFLLKYAREAQWPVMQRAMQVMEAGFVKKMNDDGFHTLLAAAVDRNILVYDADAAAGQFTKRLISLMKTTMRRNGGGNSVTAKGKLTDIYMSPEGIEDIRNWGVDQLDEVSRREVYQSADDGSPLTRIFGVYLHELLEFGDGQEYQDYFLTDLGGALASSDVELVIGMNRAGPNNFIMPVRENVDVFEDPTFHRQQRQGYYGWAEIGFACLDNRQIIAGSYQ